MSRTHGLMMMPDVPWPTCGGREVYSHHLLAALDAIGQPMHALTTGTRTADPADWPLRDRVSVHHAARPSASSCPPENRLDRRWRKYWGWSDTALANIREHVTQSKPRFVAAAGLDMLPALAVMPPDTVRIWLALDEPARFQWSLARSARQCSDKLHRTRLAATFAAYQWTYAADVDVALAVSADDARSLRHVGRFDRSINLPNGVDADFFQPSDEPSDPRTAIFWGRLDFAPNVEALRWFLRHAWPHVLAGTAEACLRVVGRHADQSLQDELERSPGVEWIGPVEDIRPWVRRAGLVVLPIRSGAGIKNKLLEAAAMARPIIASPRAVHGLEADHAWRVADRPEDWAQSMRQLWRDAQAAATLGRNARQWVVTHHCWQHNAAELLRLVDQLGTIRDMPSMVCVNGKGRQAA